MTPARPAQMEISPREPGPFSCSSFAREATIRPPVAAKGARRRGRPATLSRLRSSAPIGADSPSRSAELRVLPGRERREDRRGEGLVDLDEVEVLQRHPLALEQSRQGVGRGHQQALVARDVVHRGRLGIHDVGQHREAPLGGPLVGAQQDHRGAVGQGRAVPRSHGGVLAPAEHRPESRQLLDGRVRAQVLVPGDAQERRHEVVEEAALVRGGEIPVARRGEVVLGLAGDAPALRGLGHVLAHGQTRARLHIARHLRHDVPWPQPGQGLDPLARGGGAVQAQERLAQALAHGDGRVGRRVGPPATPESIWPTAILLATRIVASRPVPQACCTSNAGVRADRLDPRTASRVRLKSRLCLSTARRPPPRAVPPRDRSGPPGPRGRRQQVLVGGVGIAAVGAGERQPVAADDGRGAGTGGLGHGGLLACGWAEFGWRGSAWGEEA